MTAIPEFTDPRLVAVYDALNQYPRKTQPEFYAQLARDVDARLIVDLGCGTGLITRALATASSASIPTRSCSTSRVAVDTAITCAGSRAAHATSVLPAPISRS